MYYVFFMFHFLDCLPHTTHQCWLTVSALFSTMHLLSRTCYLQPISRLAVYFQFKPLLSSSSSNSSPYIHAASWLVYYLKLELCSVSSTSVFLIAVLCGWEVLCLLLLAYCYAIVSISTANNAVPLLLLAFLHPDRLEALINSGRIVSVYSMDCGILFTGSAQGNILFSMWIGAFPSPVGHCCSPCTLITFRVWKVIKIS